MRYRAEDLCRLAFLFSDSFAILGALVAAYYIRFDLLRANPAARLHFGTVGRKSGELYA